MLRYSIPFMLLVSVAMAQTTQPTQQPPTNTQPAAGAMGQSGSATQTPNQPSVAQVNARNTAIQQIEQALQILRQNNQ